jgi:predicted DNA-binding antitoxin AbrB/MazE fold protein
MKETIKAVYEDGVIKPLQKLRIKDHEKLTVTISRKPRKPKTGKPAMSMVGIFDSGIKDLSREHDKYLYGWKKTK